MKGFAVILLLTALIAVTTSQKPKRKPPIIKDQHCRITTNIRRLLKTGETYKHRCDVYTCEQGNLKTAIHPCRITLWYKQENLCQKWSKDDCCCEEIACTDVNGVKHKPGSWYQAQETRDPTRPRNEGKYCRCSVGRQKCRMQKRPRKPKRV